MNDDLERDIHNEKSSEAKFFISVMEGMLYALTVLEERRSVR